jgi:hypothetical protein
MKKSFITLKTGPNVTMFVGMVKRLALEWSILKVLNSGILQPYLQTLDLDRKAFQEQTLELVSNICKLLKKKV